MAESKAPWARFLKTSDEASASFVKFLTEERLRNENVLLGADDMVTVKQAQARIQLCDIIYKTYKGGEDGT